MLFHRAFNLLADCGVVRHPFLGCKPNLSAFSDKVSAEVRRHNDDRIAEVYLAPKGICELALLKDLQENVNDVRMALFNLVEENDRIRTLPTLSSAVLLLHTQHIQEESLSFG